VRVVDLGIGASKSDICALKVVTISERRRQNSSPWWCLGVRQKAAAARSVIELAEQVPAPRRASVETDAEEMLRVAREKSDIEQDALRLQLVGLS